MRSRGCPAAHRSTCVLPHDAPAKAPLVQPDPQSGLAPGGSTITGNSGTFDVSVAPAALESVPSAEGRRNDEGGVRGFRNQAAALPPLPAAPSAAQLEQLLVTSQAPPAADVARIEEGAIVLTTVMTSKVAGSLSNAAPAPASASGSVEYAGSTLGCFGAGCTPAASSSIGGLTFDRRKLRSSLRHRFSILWRTE